jgi:hypothetical protein
MGESIRWQLELGGKVIASICDACDYDSQWTCPVYRIPTAFKNSFCWTRV